MNSWISREHRCICGKLIFKGMILEGIVEFKCRYCNRIIIIEGILNRKNFNTVIINNEYKIVNISDSALSLLGYAREEVIGESMEKIGTISTVLYKTMFEKIKKVGSILYRTNYKTKTNERIPVNTKIIYFQQRGKEFILVIFKPINEDVFAEVETHEGPDYGDITVHLDLLGNIQFIEMSKEAKDILQYKEVDVIQKNIFDFFSDKDKDKRIKHFKNAASKERSLRVTNKILAKDGKEVYIDSYLIPQYDTFGSLCGFESSGWIQKDGEK